MLMRSGLKLDLASSLSRLNIFINSDKNFHQKIRYVSNQKHIGLIFQMSSI